MAIATAYPGRSGDGAGTPGRSGSDGSAYVLPISNKEMFAADEGTYFTAITPTPGTGIIGHAAPTTFDEAKPFIVLYNSGTLRIYPQFLRLHSTVVSTAGTLTQFTITSDVGNGRSSAGTAMTISPSRIGTAVASGAVAYIGAVVGPAVTGARVIHDHIVFRGTIDVVHDVYEIVFGGLGGGTSTASRVATVMDASRTTAPVVIEPGNSLRIVQWSASQSTGPTLQACLGFIAR